MSSFLKNDTIVAQITPYGESGVGILRISGPDSFLVLEKIFKSQKISVNEMKSHHLYLGNIYFNNQIIDSVMAVKMKSPNSFTGEDVVEIHAHGGPVNLCRILDVITSLNTRLAEPGEFSKRAYLNDKIDLSQAEAIADLIAAKSEEAANNAMSQLGGTLSKIINQLKSKIIDYASRIEVGFDFNEEDIQLMNKKEADYLLKGIFNEIKSLLDTFETGQLYKEGLRIALVGKPNVGKSSLLNALLKEEKAIIHDKPGTTRDVLEGERKIKGIIAKLYDTAGIRESDDHVEKEGIKRSEQTLEKADLILLVLDSSQNLSREDEKLIEKVKEKKTIFIANKMDLKPVWNFENLKFKNASFENFPKIKISAKTNEGLENLLDEIEKLTLNNNLSTDHNFILNNVRHKKTLEKVLEQINSLSTQMEIINEECLAEELRIIARLLSEITGTIDNEKILDEIFSRFCIGK